MPGEALNPHAGDLVTFPEPHSLFLSVAFHSAGAASLLATLRPADASSPPPDATVAPPYRRAHAYNVCTTVPTISGDVLNSPPDPDHDSFPPADKMPCAGGLTDDIINNTMAAADDVVRPPNHAVRPALVPLQNKEVNLPPTHAHPATTTFQAHPLAPHHTVPSSSPPRAYDVTDPELFWLNERPYLLKRAVGKGGFGEVHMVEMMLPLGMSVQRRPKTGAFALDADGRVCVQLTKGVPIVADKSSPSAPAIVAPQREPLARPSTPGEVAVADDSVTTVVQLSEAAPESMNFFKIQETLEDIDGNVEGGIF